MPVDINDTFYYELLKAYPGGILCEDATRRLLWINSACQEMWGIPGTLAELRGLDCSQAAHQAKHAVRDPVYFVARIERLLRERVEVLGDLVYLKDGRCLERDYRPVFEDRAYAGHVWFYRDTTELHKLSTQDALTGLYNRRGFDLFAEQYLRLAQRQGQKSYVCFADVDGLKQINDTQGHEKGDERIQDAAKVLAATFRDSDLVARLSGDEFAVLLIGDLDEVGMRNRLNKALAAANGPSISCGFAEHCASRTLAETLELADSLMYEDKQAKKESA